MTLPRLDQDGKTADRGSVRLRTDVIIGRLPCQRPTRPRELAVDAVASVEERLSATCAEIAMPFAIAGFALEGVRAVELMVGEEHNPGPAALPLFG